MQLGQAGGEIGPGQTRGGEVGGEFAAFLPGGAHPGDAFLQFGRLVRYAAAALQQYGGVGGQVIQQRCAVQQAAVEGQDFGVVSVGQGFQFLLDALPDGGVATGKVHAAGDGVGGFRRGWALGDGEGRQLFASGDGAHFIGGGDGSLGQGVELADGVYFVVK